ncbi:MAG TPA: hypothetical protein VFO20_10230, partial [Propionibacteriaceae bacterium]|nr:hypothetical protein [Propionibacteriaceae bacterium]
MVWPRLAIVGVDLDVAVIGAREAGTVVGIGAYWVILTRIPFLAAVRMSVERAAGGSIGRAVGSASACGWSVRRAIAGAGRIACIAGVSAVASVDDAVVEGGSVGCAADWCIVAGVDDAVVEGGLSVVPPTGALSPVWTTLSSRVGVLP